MNKPIEITNITIINDKMTPKEAQELAQAIRKKNQQELRDYEIYKKGLRDGGNGGGFFGGLF